MNVDADTSEEDDDSLPSMETSGSDDDYDVSETEKESISIQEDEISPSVSEKIDTSMPLID